MELNFLIVFILNNIFYKALKDNNNNLTIIKSKEHDKLSTFLGFIISILLITNSNVLIFM